MLLLPAPVAGTGAPPPAAAVEEKGRGAARRREEEVDERGSEDGDERKGRRPWLPPTLPEPRWRRPTADRDENEDDWGVKHSRISDDAVVLVGKGAIVETVRR